MSRPVAALLCALAALLCSAVPAAAEVPSPGPLPGGGYLAPGSAGGDVRDAQRTLREAGFPLEVDGRFGPRTAAVVRDFQSDAEIVVDGIIGRQTDAALREATEREPAVEEEDAGTDENGEETDEDGVAGGLVPETTILSGPEQLQPTTDRTARLTFKALRRAAKLQCRVDTGAWRACRSPLVLRDLAPGRHRLRVRAVAGRLRDRTPAVWSWVIGPLAEDAGRNGRTAPAATPTPAPEPDAEPVTGTVSSATTPSPSATPVGATATPATAAATPAPTAAPAATPAATSTPAPAPVPPAPLPEVPTDALWVAPDGLDTAAGTAQQPLRTLAKAIAVAVPGTTVVLRPGTYGGSGVRTDFNRSGTESAPITITGEPGAERPVVHGGVRIYASHIRLRGLRIVGPTGPVQTKTTANPGGEDVKVAVYGDFVEISGSEIADSLWHAGIYTSAADGFVFEGNHIHHNGAFGVPEQANLDHGLYIGSGSGRIVNNVIADNLAYGVHLYPRAANVLVAHNTIVRHGRAGVIIATESSNNRVAGNIIAFNTQNSVRSYALTGTNNVVEDNVVWANGSGNIGSTAEGLTLRDNVQADPGFAPGTLEPSAAGPAVDRSAEAAGVVRDIAGRERDDAPDAGAYEVG